MRSYLIAVLIAVAATYVLGQEVVTYPATTVTGATVTIPESVVTISPTVSKGGPETTGTTAAGSPAGSPASGTESGGAATSTPAGYALLSDCV